MNATEAGCDDCKIFKIYSSEKDALRHLRDHHVPRGFPEAPKSAMKEFLVPMTKAREFLRIIHLVIELRKCRDRLRSLCKCTSDIQAGMLSDGEFSNPLDRLPASLLLAFERVVLLIRCTCATAIYIDNVFKPSPFSEMASLSVGSLSSRHEILDELARDAVRYMHRAQADIVYSLATGKSVEQGSFYNEVGPNYVVAQMMSNLLGSKISLGLNIVEVYQRYLEDIVSVPPTHPWWLI